MSYQNSKLVAHLARDEKFIDVAIRSFELNGCKNELYVYGSHKCKYINSTINGRIRPIDSIFGGLAKQLNSADLIVIHSLNEQWVNIILKVNKNIPIVWLGIGVDYYTYLYPKASDLLLNETKKTLSKSADRKKTERIKSGIKNIIVNAFIRHNFLRAINRIDYFSPILVNEYSLVKRMLGLDYFPQQVIWQYGNLEEDLIKGFENEYVDGNNLLVGNSSTIENNHIDTFILLKEIDLKSKVIICPLSYGDDSYRDIVTAKALEFFGSDFESLINFVPMKTYVKKIKSCGFVLMNHIRQQGLGNIVIMLYLGAKVFLRKENPVYKFLKDEGVLIFSIQELELDNTLLDQRLSISDIAINRAIICDNFSKFVVESKAKVMLNRVFKHEQA